MTGRQRVKAALNFQSPDELPCNEEFWDGTLATWQEQGMPADVGAVDYFRLDVCTMAVDASPRFEQKVLKHADGWITYQDRFGYTVKKSDGIASSMEFSAHATTDRKAWEDVKPRFSLADDPAEPARLDDASYFAHFDPYPTWEQAAEKYRRLYASGRYMLFNFYGPWEATWRHRGLENLLMDLASDPDWVGEMAGTYQDLVIAVLDRCTAQGMRPDGVFVIDDLGSTRSMLMSPKSWRSVLKPVLGRLGEFVRERGIDLWIHSCGAIQPVLDDLLEVGVQVVNPLQAAAGHDLVELRKRYGRRMSFCGNIDVRKMIGSRSELADELRRKVPLSREGGFIFHSDHSIPPQVSFDQYCWMLETARRLFHGLEPS